VLIATRCQCRRLQSRLYYSAFVALTNLRYINVINNSNNNNSTVTRPVRPSVQVQSGCGTLCRYTFDSYLPTVSRPISAVSVSFEHRTTSFFIVSTALFLSEVTVHCLLHGFLDTRLLILHSWCDIARIQNGTVIGR